MAANDRVPEPTDGSMRDVLVGWLRFHRSALEAKCAELDADRLVERSAPPSPLSLLGLVRHITEMERVYGSWALGPAGALLWVWGEYADGGPDWDIEADASMVRTSSRRHRAGDDRRPDRRPPLGSASVGAGNGRSLGWNLQKLIGEYARHNGHADLNRRTVDGQPAVQSDAPERRRWRIRQIAIASATTVTISEPHDRAAALRGCPRARAGSAGRRASPTKIARDSHVGESWAMPVSAAPSSRSTRNTNASDHTAVRRVMQPMAMNTATYGDAADGGGERAPARRSPARRRRPRRARTPGRS